MLLCILHVALLCTMPVQDNVDITVFSLCNMNYVQCVAVHALCYLALASFNGQSLSSGLTPLPLLCHMTDCTQHAAVHVGHYVDPAASLYHYTLLGCYGCVHHRFCPHVYIHCSHAQALLGIHLPHFRQPSQVAAYAPSRTETTCMCASGLRCTAAFPSRGFGTQQ